ncbi:MAG: hypothetical protein AAF485_27395 [Chloroflexota bacterium]
MNSVMGKAMIRRLLGILTLSILASLSLVVVAQDDVQDNSNDSALYRAEQLLLNGSYAAAAEMFQMADGLDFIKHLKHTATPLNKKLTSVP